MHIFFRVDRSNSDHHANSFHSSTVVIWSAVWSVILVGHLESGQLSERVLHSEPRGDGVEEEDGANVAQQPRVRRGGGHLPARVPNVASSRVRRSDGCREARGSFVRPASAAFCAHVVKDRAEEDEAVRERKVEHRLRSKEQPM